MKRLFALRIKYIIAVLICMTAVLYFARDIKNLQNTQKELEKAYLVFEKTNEMAYFLNAAQANGERYIITRNGYFLEQMHDKIDNGLQVMDVLFVDLCETRQEQFLSLTNLFDEKMILLEKLSDTNEFPNFLDVLIQHAQMPKHITDGLSHIGSQLEVDTTFIEDKRGFIQRVFSRGQGASQIITIRQSDSIVNEIKTTEYASTSQLTTIDDLLKAIQRNQYKQELRFRILEQKYMDLISADQRIGQDISEILIQLHQISFDRLTEMLLQKDRAFRKNLLIGILAFLLIFGIVFEIFRDARQSMQKSRELEESNRVKEELMAARHQLLLAISHDINAPLCSILTYLEFWKKDHASTEEICQLSSMQNSAVHILDMLKNLLEFSRLEQKKIQIQNQTIEPIPFFLEIVDLFKPLSDEKHLKFLYRFENLKNAEITLDSLKLRQIVINLISNAIRYTSKGEIKLFVEFLNDSQRLKIVISDTGIGIPAEQLDTIFEPFVQAENRSVKVEGTGLGLFVVKGLVDVMNGTITVESSEKGTTFEIELPT